MAEADRTRYERTLLARDALLAMAALNGEVKLVPRRKAAVYRLKARLIAAFWREGYCVEAQIDAPRQWLFTFRVGGVRVRWHLPADTIRFRAQVFVRPDADTGTRPYPPDASQRSRMATVKAYLKQAEE